MQTLHSFQFVYRDLKPENILLDSDNHIRLTDFGLSKRLTNKFFSKTPARTDSLRGTLEYISPEIILGNPYSYEVDWYSLGMVLIEMLGGKNPHKLNKNKATFE